MGTRIDLAERCGRYLSSRRIARQIRDEVKALVDAGDHVTVSFDGVVCVSNSFADGLLGVLVLERGRAWFDRSITIAGLGLDVCLDIDAVIALRT